jgi:hypothetical protein
MLEANNNRWPRGVLRRGIRRPRGMLEVGMYLGEHTCMISDARLVEDGRFPFEMLKYWGDLRKLINTRMQQKNNQSPPFTEIRAIWIMYMWGMRNLHRRKILHPDLKASNILIHNSSTRHDPSRTDSASEFRSYVADFECSVGVVGTRFWRAPKILLAL